jgi:hypothetical protein
MFLRGPERLQKIRSADLVVVLTSDNNEGSIRYVAETLAQGLRSDLRELKPVIVNIDGGSLDGTPQEFQRADIHKSIEYLTIEYPHGSIDTRGFQDVFASARAIGAQFIAFVAAESPSIEASWLSKLVSPLIEGPYHYISPLFREAPCFTMARDYFHYPLFASLFGLLLRAPHADYFALSGGVLGDLVKDEEDPERHRAGGATIVMTGIEKQWKMAECALGALERSGDFLHFTERYTAGKLRHFIALVDDRASLWQKERQLRGLERLGEIPRVPVPLPPLDPQELWRRFEKGLELHRETLKECVAPVLNRKLGAIAVRPLRLAEFDDPLWVELSVELVHACHEKSAFRDRILALLPSLFYGKAAPFFASRSLVIDSEWEKGVENLVLLFGEKRKEFVHRWGTEHNS